MAVMPLYVVPETVIVLDADSVADVGDVSAISAVPEDDVMVRQAVLGRPSTMTDESGSATSRQPKDLIVQSPEMDAEGTW